jgi:hypothetical protein
VTRRRDKKIQAAQQVPQTGSGVSPEPKFHDAEIQLSYKFYDPGGEYCLSQCDEHQVITYKQCLKKLSSYTFGQLLGTSTKTKGEKTGLHWEVFPNGVKSAPPLPAGLDPGCKLACVRASERMRIFVTHFGRALYILWYDKDHKLCQS